MYVLGGLLVEHYHEQMKMTSRAKVKDKKGAMVGLFEFLKIRLKQLLILNEYYNLFKYTM